MSNANANANGPPTEPGRVPRLKNVALYHVPVQSLSVLPPNPSAIKLSSSPGFLESGLSSCVPGRAGGALLGIMPRLDDAGEPMPSIFTGRISFRLPFGLHLVPVSSLLLLVLVVRVGIFLLMDAVPRTLHHGRQWPQNVDPMHTPSSTPEQKPDIRLRRGAARK
jgi:hypothetical protein